MKQINFKGLGTKVAGLAAGTVAAGFVQKGISKLGLSGMLSNVAIIAVGALGPDLLGKRNPLIGFAGDAVMVKGINGIITEQFPSLISGTEDVAGAYGDYEVGDAADDEVGDVDEQGFVSGAEYDVAGVVGGGNSL
ncbi:hypothetical protein Q5H93_02955 [Hymenobacter sp. ASUV-10]|uniref:Uncharacterized protein n=1 Tax=Hymenobacter aranciens TaxID=3063996 RepID=A0ABT9B663_9BACT|nr:hypothetical protein [Hymenobacter sp. ASUV-10]MDO7873678.1 hypothetical protein [Hymenobacter sp. ASUV-10]